MYFNDICHVQVNRKNIWLLEALKILGEDNIKFCSHDRFHHHVMQGGYMTIDEMINSNIFSKAANSIKSVKIMYVPQLITNNNCFKIWKYLKKQAGRSSKGKIPTWFREIETNLLKIGKLEKYMIVLNYFGGV